MPTQLAFWLEKVLQALLLPVRAKGRLLPVPNGVTKVLGKPRDLLQHLLAAPSALLHLGLVPLLPALYLVPVLMGMDCLCRFLVLQFPVHR